MDIIRISPEEWNNTPALNPGEFVRLPAGGYVCKIVNAKLENSKAGNLMLILFVDVAEGEYRGHFQAAVDRVKNPSSDIKWDNSGIYRQLVYNREKKIAPYFKGLITVIEKSNAGFAAYQNEGINPATLVGKLCGFIFAEEEYSKRDGSIGMRTFAKNPVVVDDIRSGNFTVPDLKKLDSSKSPTPKSQTDNIPELEDPPF